MVVGSESERPDALFHALADPTRRDILAVVLQDAHSVSDLARRYPISFAAVHTFADEIVDPCASRVFTRFAFGYGQDPVAPVVDTGVVIVCVLQATRAVACLPAPHAETSTLAAASRATPSAV